MWGLVVLDASFNLVSSLIQALTWEDMSENVSPPPSPKLCAAVHITNPIVSSPSTLPALESFPTTPHFVLGPPSATLDPSSSTLDLLSSVDAASSNTISSAQKRKLKRNMSAKNARSKRREKAAEALSYRVHAFRASQKATSQKTPVSTSTSVHCEINVHDLPVTSTAFTALDPPPNTRKRRRAVLKSRTRRKPQPVFTLADLVGPDSKFRFKLVKASSTPTAIVDSDDRIIGVVANHPDDKDWAQLMQEAADALESHRDSVSQNDLIHRRGAFKALRCGVSYGGGQEVPGNLVDGDNADILKALNSMKAFKRLASFASSVMCTWASSLFNYYATMLDGLHNEHRHLVRIFRDSIFSAVSYNFGPRTVCYKHKDYANLAFGFCAITALGTFDYTKGGHLVLWDLQLVIEFPAGCTILIPSALIAHSNIPVAEHERRYSFAQYTAGGLFRWVSHGFKTREDYLATLSCEELAAHKENDSKRWEFGLSMFSKWQDMKGPRHSEH
ncbi:hypothetical protein JR316_0005316 [Psilocybe cubensis]|uniref:Uncharacterized protein n=1 Tax=Psilocybe cubensis TaxID=181762 RepID=A0ACB8H6D2_PSICU|nr:hypothetical protein JR316_0005316 [Psilocybe cubensis]KAH9483212.1 hypothetical protein JR316_0005316 [Psilocybe cubensis]